MRSSIVRFLIPGSSVAPWVTVRIYYRGIPRHCLAGCSEVMGFWANLLTLCSPPRSAKSGYTGPLLRFNMAEPGTHHILRTRPLEANKPVESFLSVHVIYCRLMYIAKSAIELLLLIEMWLVITLYKLTSNRLMQNSSKPISAGPFVLSS